MGILDIFRGKRVELPEDDEGPRRGEEIPAPESEIRREKKFALVLSSEKDKRGKRKLERREIIGDIDTETGEVTIKGEKGKPEHLTHEKFWRLNFPKSGEMLGEVERERRKVVDRTMAGDVELEKANEAALGHIDSVIEAFKAGELGPMRDFFAEPLARLKREAKGWEKFKEERRENINRELEKIAEIKKSLDNLEEQLAALAKREAELIAGKARVAVSDRAIYEEQLRGNRGEQAKLKEKMRGMIWDIGTENMHKADLEKLDKETENPELKRMRDFVRILEEEIAARRKKMAA